MVDWHLPLGNILDGLTLPQFRLLTKMRERRLAETRRWDLVKLSPLVQTDEGAEWLQGMLETQEDIIDGTAPIDMGGGFTVSKRYPLLHEMTPVRARMLNMDKLITFRVVED